MIDEDEIDVMLDKLKKKTRKRKWAEEGEEQEEEDFEGKRRARSASEAEEEHKITTFADLYKYTHNIPLDTTNERLQNLRKLLPVFDELHNEIIGLEPLKNETVRMWLHICAWNTAKSKSKMKLSMKNIWVYGASGTGKTTIATLFCRALISLGLLPATDANRECPFILGSRSNMIAGFQGRTAPKTEALLNKCREEKRVLFIDEASQFGHNEDGPCAFSKEALDTLTQALSRYPDELFCIIAGYKEKTRESFFQGNEGLARRFKYIYNMGQYSISDLRFIFLKLLAKMNGAQLVNSEVIGTEDWFRQNLTKLARQISWQTDQPEEDVMKNFGPADMETLVYHAIGAHTQRTFDDYCAQSILVSKEDLEDAFTIFWSHKLGKATDPTARKVQRLTYYS